MIPIGRQMHMKESYAVDAPPLGIVLTLVAKLEGGLILRFRDRRLLQKQHRAVPVVLID